jgi:RCC1 and BTB domain-containing protein
MENAPSEENEEAVRQLKMIMNTKTMDMIEQEDEKMQADIFAFLQYSRKPKAVPEDSVPEDLCERVLAALQSHQHKGQQRLSGLQIFSRLLHVTDSNPSCRRSIIPSLSTAFKRFVHRGDANASVAVEKVHYSDGLEFAGPWLFKSIRDEFFKLLGSLLAIGNDHVAIVRQSIEKGSCGDLTELKALSSQAHEAVLEVVQILEACSVPYQGDDWDSIHTIQFLPLVTELSSWRSWKTTLQLNFVDDHRAETPGGGVIPILAAASGQRCPKIICARAITIGTDLQQLKVSGNEGGGGGMAVFHHSLNRGRWYWEISILSQDERSVFIGLASNTDDLNQAMPSQTHVGIHVFRDTTGLVVGSSEEGSPHQMPSLRCPLGGTIGVLLDCVDKTLTFFVGARHAKVLSLESSCHGNLYPALGLQGAGTELCWNLLAPVPVRIGSMTSGFRFSAPVVSGCLIASPIDGKTISLDAKTKGRRLRLSPDGTTVIAGDFSMLSEDNVVETITANQAFETDALFAEVQVLSSGRDGRCQFAFGLVGVDMAIDKDFMKRHAVEVTSTEDALLTGAFGVLFEFATGTVTVYPPSGGEPLSRVVLMETATSRRLLIPALSVLCNGSVFRVNFHPRPRPELPLANAVRPASIGDNCHVSSSNDLQIGKVLAMHVLNCDGGEFSGSHAAKNCLVDDASVFSSAKGRNIHLVLRHEIDTPFCLSYLTVRGPGPGYSSPLRHALVFVTSSVPDLQRLQEYDDFTPEEFASLPFPAASLRSDRLEYMPVAYVVLDGSCAQVAKQLAVPVQGRYIVVKLLCASSSSCTNIDVGYVGFCGTFDKDNGPAYADHAVTAAVCEACQASSLYGVTYSLKEDDSVKLCASCYDDHRGSLEATFFAHIGLETVDGQGDDGFALCVARKAHVELLTAQVAQAACRRSRSPPGSNISSGPMPMSMDSSVGGYLSESGTKSERALMWFDDCELFSCGQNNYGELCLGHCNSTTKLEHVPFFSTKSTRDIAGGNEVLAVLMKDGTVFTCGLNKSGQCGNGTFDERVLAATPVRALQGVAIEMIAAANGCEHMLAVASDGAVYSWGYNDRGQLGLGSTISKSHTPRLIESLREKYVITTAAVSYHHSAVISSAGELLTFGMNDCGQLGLDHLQHQHTPQLVDALSSQVAVKVACGLYHTVVATASGELYAFGKNDYGQLGLGHARNLKVPTLVRVAIGDSDERIVDVSCGYYHTVAITDKGKLLTWGRNDYGQLGIGSKDHKNTPQYVPLPLSSRIRKSSCGCYHTLILLANGRVMVFGRNNKGQLGAGARTLPSADLPLPIPLHSLSNDEVMCVAAGFYSSYILTGRPSQSQDPERAKEDHAQATDLADQHSSSQALYESLMKEIDRKQHKPLSIEKVASIQMMKRASMRRKLPLLKLHAAAWAMVRALLYQSLGTTDISNSQQLAASNKRCVVSRSLAAFLLDNMRELQNEILELRSHGRWDASSVTLKNACVGLLTQCVTRSQIPHTPVSLHPDRLPLPSLYPHLFRNQLLWVLLSCGAADASLCSVLASNGHVLDEILRGMTASDLSSATICIRLAMLVFPMHSVSSVNAAYRTVLGSTTASASSCPNILSVLMLVVGHPLVLRPRLCSHELGIERSCSPLCESAKCLKGLAVSEDKNINGLKEDVLERSHIAAAKAAEVVALLRYLTLYPTWKVAVNASITKAFAKTEMIGEILDAVCAYYAGLAGRDAEDTEEPITTVIEPVETEQLNDITTTAQENATREPETTTAGSPEIDDTGIPEGRDDADKEEDDAPSSGVLLDTLIRDKKDLQAWQKAKESLDALASILAAVCLVGGHIETLREGAIAIIEDADHKSRGKAGVLSGIKRDPRGELCASVQLIESSTSGWQPLQRGGITISSVGIRNLKPVERVPALLHMFNCLDGVICSLSLLVLPPSHDGHAYYELNLPQINRVQEMLGRRLQLYSQQLQWRATMALSNLLKQMPQLSTELINADTQLLSNIAQTIAAEDPLQNTSALTLVQASSSMTANVVDVLHTRWVGLKQRQLWLETDHILDDALDCYELETRDDVVRKLGQQNALSWGPDAIQSPRKGSTSSSFFNGKSSGAYQLGGLQRSERDRTEAGTRPGGRTTLPQGAWGVLHPLPPLNENESGGVSSPAAVDAVPFPLTTPVVRVGRAADSCDLIVNDRSVSGRHFHLRRIRRDHHEGGGSVGGAEEFFELQDFSKNGTIVNGIRVHGTSVRVTPGSRISLILSRGGLVTYEFQVRPSHGSAGLTTHRMAPPPPILTGPPQAVDSNITLIQGQEYQQPLSAVGPGPAHMEPRSPAEIQNRGSRQQSMESVRSRMPGGQGGLRLITSIAESEVPRALISPNPAVESPRVGGFSSPRSSILQAPGTPAVPSATANLFASLGPAGVLSPASYQQRESAREGGEAAMLRAPEPTTPGTSSDGLRIALGRDSFTRESGQHNSIAATSAGITVMEPPRLKTSHGLNEGRAMVPVRLQFTLRNPSDWGRILTFDIFTGVPRVGSTGSVARCRLASHHGRAV